MKNLNFSIGKDSKEKVRLVITDPDSGLTVVSAEFGAFDLESTPLHLIVKGADVTQLIGADNFEHLGKQCEKQAHIVGTPSDWDTMDDNEKAFLIEREFMLSKQWKAGWIIHDLRLSEPRTADTNYYHYIVIQRFVA